MGNFKKYGKLLILICTIFILFNIFSCSKNNNEIITITNELSFCDNSHVFWRIIKHSNTNGDVISLKDSIVFLKFNKNLRTEHYYSMFFPDKVLNRYEAVVKGRFARNKMNNTSYGCQGCSIFIINEIISFKNVTLRDTFPINYCK